MKFFSATVVICIFLATITPCDGKRIGETRASPEKTEASKTHRFLQYFKTQIATENFNIKVETPTYAFGKEVTEPWKFPNPWEIMANPSEFFGYTVGNLTQLFGNLTTTRESGALCFSPNTIVDLLDESEELMIQKKMKDIEVGDKVLTASGEYETIYSFAHRHASKPTEFVQIHAGDESSIPLELTKGHMVFVEGKSNPVPVSTISVGSKLQNVHGESSTVTKIATVTRNGLYAPLTKDGTVVVNSGIIASVYATVPGLFNEAEYFEIAGVKLSYQSFYDTLLTPYRHFCNDISTDLCRTTSERDAYTWFGMILYGKWMEQSDVVKSMSLSVFLSFLYVMRVVASNHYVAISAVFAFVAIYNAKSKKQKFC